MRAVIDELACLADMAIEAERDGRHDCINSPNACWEAARADLDEATEEEMKDGFEFEYPVKVEPGSQLDRILRAAWFAQLDTIRTLNSMREDANRCRSCGKSYGSNPNCEECSEARL